MTCQHQLSWEPVLVCCRCPNLQAGQPQEQQVPEEASDEDGGLDPGLKKLLGVREQPAKTPKDAMEIIETASVALEIEDDKRAAVKVSQALRHEASAEQDPEEIENPAPFQEGCWPDSEAFG